MKKISGIGMSAAMTALLAASAQQGASGLVSLLSRGRPLQVNRPHIPGMESRAERRSRLLREGSKPAGSKLARKASEGMLGLGRHANQKRPIDGVMAGRKADRRVK